LITYKKEAVMEYIPISIIGLLFLVGCTAIICSILFETHTNYTYKPSEPKQEDVIDLELYGDE
tara:strand:- start:182 stop:370 length:189 start_codon:yes stop_codon:yes gene_type:complete